MNRKKSFQQVVGVGLLLFMLAGCGSNGLDAVPTSIPPSSTPLATLTSTPTLTPTITPSPTSTSIPIPPIPTVEVLGQYGRPKVKITDWQGIETTIEVYSVEIENDIVLTYASNPYSVEKNFPLKIADGIYAIVPWCSFRRAYLSEGGYTVTLDDGKELKGQLDFKLNDVDVQSIITIVADGISQTDLDLCHLGKWATTHTLHILEPTDQTLSVTYPRFAVEYTTNSGQAADSTEIFSVGLDDVKRKLSSQDEIILNKDGQITARTNGVEKTGPLIPILETTFGESFHKGTTPNWYLEATWPEFGLDILVKVPAWILTKISN